MKKDTTRIVIVAMVILLAYHLIAFAIPFARTAAFWISYGFGLVAVAVTAASLYFAFVVKPDAKSKLYGFPIARIGVIYGVGQMAVTLLVMALARWTPWWIPLVVDIVALGVTVIGLTSADAAAEEAQTQDVQMKKDVSVMRTLQSQMGQIAAQSDDVQIKTLADEFRYSDPVSNDGTAAAERELTEAVNQLQQAVVDGNRDEIAKCCRKTAILLEERNRLCRLNKN